MPSTCQEKKERDASFFFIKHRAKLFDVMPRKPKNPVTSILAKNIKRLRDQRGWTQKQLAERIGHEEPAHVSQMERGIRGAGIDIRKKLCEVFAVEEGELFRSESEWGLIRETGRVTGETVPGSYGVPDLSRHRVVEVATPTKTETRRRMVAQLDRILEHPEQTLARAIEANLDAFATVADHAERLNRLERENAELKKEIAKLKLMNELLAKKLRDNPVTGCEAATDKLQLENNGGPT